MQKRKWRVNEDMSGDLLGYVKGTTEEEARKEMKRRFDEFALLGQEVCVECHSANIVTIARPGRWKNPGTGDYEDDYDIIFEDTVCDSCGRILATKKV